MSKLTIEIPEHIQTQVSERVAKGAFANASDYVQSLIISDLRRAEIDALLIEAEDAYERGDFTVHKSGDYDRMYEEIKRRREQATTS